MPSTVDAVDPLVKPYFSFQSEISYHDKVLLKGQRVIVPSKLLDEMKQVLHYGIVGIEKTKCNARNTLYWPNINAEITNMISNCSTSIEYRNSQAQETLVQHEAPSSAWVKVGTDLFALFNKDYVIVVDYYSKFFEISLIPDKESSTVITHVKSIFSRHGVPKEVISDNGPEFSSYEFSTLAKEWDLHHNPSSPRYPQSNGLVERTIQTVKKTLRKVVKSENDVYFCLLALRTASSKDNEKSPAFKLMNKKSKNFTSISISFQRFSRIKHL